MNLKLSSLAVCRTPLFSLDQNLSDVWDELKRAILESSPEFYRKIADLNYQDLDFEEPKVRFTVWKYFNRSKYRETPFGELAAFATFRLSDTPREAHFVVSKQMIAHRFTSWLEKDQVKIKGRSGLKKVSELQLNPSIYPCGNEFRYISALNGQFEIAAIEHTSMITQVIRFFNGKREKSDFLKFLSTNYAMEHHVGLEFIVQLVDLQILFTDQQPNITGIDYFRRIDYKNIRKHTDYIISERKVDNVGTDIEKLKILPELITFLGKIMPDEPSSALSGFKKTFVKKFEDREVPLLTALDPEMGVGYHNLERADQVHSIVDELIPLIRNRASSADINYSPLHQFLLNKMVKGGIIHLEEYTGTKEHDENKFPNTFTVLCGISDGQVILTGGGGATSNALSGRFTYASAELEEDGKRLAEIEKNANPDVLFFDVAYQAERDVDNINRRKLLYPVEAPVLAWSCAEKQLDLNDILISVHQDELILRSQKYDTRVVPRIASAYNYNRSDLSIYRFLCDLQSQSLKANFVFDLKDYFPQLESYPRVQYKQVVLSPAAWLLPQTGFKLSAIKAWLSEKGIQSFFSTGHNDQVLYFDPSKDTDLEAFLQYCRGCGGRVYIHEAFVPANSLVRDEQNRPYKACFLVNLVHHEKIYQSISGNKKVPAYLPMEALKLPGEWLYFEIYSHPERQDQLLTDIISPYIKEISTELKNWFFIRYSDPSPHIRLRLQLKKKTDQAAFMEKLTFLLSSDLYLGLVSDFKVKLYRREMERYGPENMDAVEKCFGADSRYALKFVKYRLNERVKYFYVLKLIIKVMDKCKWGHADQVNTVRSIASAFAKEMKVNTGGFKLINKEYRTFLRDGPSKFEYQKLEKITPKLVETFCKTVMNCDVSQQVSIFSDLVHMHINRLFVSDQRVHEMIIYQFLMTKLRAKENGMEI